MFKMAFVDDSPLITSVCEKLLISRKALQREDKFDKFTNSRAFMEAFKYLGPNYYDLVIADHHLEENEDTKGYDLLLHIQLSGYQNAAVLYSADNKALLDISMIINNHKISLLQKDAPGSTASIDYLVKLVFKLKGIEWK